MSQKAAITLNINGRGYPIEVEPRRTLADAIREDCGQTGTHIGCEHGICGACTVIVNGDPVRSCLMFAIQRMARRSGPLKAWRRATSCTRCSRPLWTTTAFSAVFARRVS